MTADFFTDLDPGDRIVIRYRIPAHPPARDGRTGDAALLGGPHFSDAIGNFVSLDDGLVTLMTRSGSVTVAQHDVTHAKRVPPAPQRRGGQRR